MSKIIYTSGYEGITVEGLIGRLKDARIKVLLDVRAVPLSRKPGFSKNKLAAHLREHGISYVGLKGLGTPAEGRAAARKGDRAALRRIFLRHLRTTDAVRDMEEALKIAQKSRACLLCFEHDPLCCHRLFVAEEMALKGGFAIEHLHGPLTLALPF